VPTTLGPLQVAVVGSTDLPALVTYHDAGLTPEQTFGGFLGAPDVGELARFFCWYHVYAPGTHHGAMDWKEYERSIPSFFPFPRLSINHSDAFLRAYPTMDKLASQLGEVLRYLSLTPAIVWGVGAGGNIALRLASAEPDIVKGIIVTGATGAAASMYEYSDTIFSKLGSLLWASNDVYHATNRLLARFYSKTTCEESRDMVSRTRSFLSQMSGNMLKFAEAYEKRDDITARCKNIKASVLFIMGQDSPHAADQDETYHAIMPPMGARRPSLSAGTPGKYIVRLTKSSDLATEENAAMLLQPMALFFISMQVKGNELSQLPFVRDAYKVSGRKSSLSFVYNRDDEKVSLD